MRTCWPLAAGAGVLLLVGALAPRGGLAVLPEAPDWGWPVQGVVSSLFGPRWGTKHEGIDLGTPIGSKVVASRDGRVVKAGDRGKYGLCIELEHSDGWTSRYAHLSRIDVPVGRWVVRGQSIGLSGDTGHTTGPHVHFEIRDAAGQAVDPGEYAR